MPAGTLIGRAFVRIDADTKPLSKALQSVGSAASLGGLLAAGPAVQVALAGATTAAFGLANSLAAAGAAGGALALAVVPQFKQITEASQKLEQVEDQRAKATVQGALAQEIAKKYGFEYGKQVEITAQMSAQAKERAQEYNAALSASKTSTKAAKEGQALYEAKLKQMPKATQDTAQALENLKDTTKNWSDSLAGSTMPIFTRLIKLLQSALPSLTPIVKGASDVVSNFVNNLGEGRSGRVFGLFAANIRKNAVPAFQMILEVGKNIIVGLAGVFNAFEPFQSKVTGGLVELTRRFAEWGESFSMGGSGAQGFFQMLREEGPPLLDAFKDIASVIGSALDGLGPLAGVSLKVAEALAELLAAIPPGVLEKIVQAIVLANLAMRAYAIGAGIATAAQWAFTTSITTSTGAVYTSRAVMVAHRITMIASTVATYAAAAATTVWSLALRAGRLAVLAFRYAMVILRLTILLTSAAFRVLAVAILSNPIGLIIIAIVALVAIFIVLWKRFEGFRNFWKATWRVIWGAIKFVWEWIRDNWKTLLVIITGPIGIAVLLVIKYWDKIWGAAKFAFNWIKDNWKLVLAIITGPIGIAVGLVIKYWKQIRDFFVDAWGYVVRLVWNPWRDLFTKKIPSWARDARDALKTAFRVAVLFILDRFGDVLRGAVKMLGWVPGVGGKLKGAEKAFRTFRDNVNTALGGIDSNKKIKVPLLMTVGGKTLNVPGFYATGGPVFGPGTETSDSIPARLSKNEHVWTAAEVRAAGGHGSMMRMRALARYGALPAFATGGGVGVSVYQPSGSSIRSSVNKLIKDRVAANAARISQAVLEQVEGAAVSGYTPGRGVSQWSSVVLKSLALVGQSSALLNTTLRRMNQESGGNPKAVNKWDSNWQAGYPSVGLMQVIRPTFRSNAGRFVNTGPFMYGVSINPLANVYASMRYALRAYGSLSRAYNRAGGYDLGGLANGSGMMLKPTLSPERVLSPRQTAAFESAMNNGFGGGGRIVVVLVNQGSIGSQRELDTWLTASLERLQRTNRLGTIVQKALKSAGGA